MTMDEYVLDVTRIKLSITDYIRAYSGNDYWSLDYDVEEWLEECEIKYNFHYTYETITNETTGCSHITCRFYLDFEDPNDAIMFRIRWPI